MKKVIVRGPALSRSGYGEHTRFLLRSLRDSGEFDIYLINTPWGATSWLYEDNDERAWIDKLLMKTLESDHQDPFDVSLQVTIPNEWQPIAKKNIGVTAGIETDAVSDGWLQKTWSVDKIIVPSEHSKNSFLNKSKVVKSPTGDEVTVSCETPIDVVSYPVRDIETKDIGADLNIDTKFNFVTVAQMSPRKNIEAALLAFLEEFQNEEVGYVLKMNIKNNSLIDQTHTEASIASLLNNYPDRKCKVYLVHGNMTDEEMAGLYNDSRISGYVSTSHGEGFGLPIFEAASHGVPVVAPHWGGYVDFLPEKDILSVDYELRNVHNEAVWNGVIEKDSKWGYVHLNDLRTKMRELHNNKGKYDKKAKSLQSKIRKKYSTKNQYSRFVESIKEVLQ